MPDGANIKDFPAKVCVPIKTGKSAEYMETYPEQDAVSLDFRGAYEDLWQGYKAVHSYIKKHKLKQNGNPQEIYFESFATGILKDQCLTRIIIPVKNE